MDIKALTSRKGAEVLNRDHTDNYLSIKTLEAVGWFWDVSDDSK